MTDKAFRKGIGILKLRVKTLDFNPEDPAEIAVIRELLDDLSDEEFLGGVYDLLQTLKEIYPNTNLIAHIRERAFKFRVKESGEDAWETLTKELWSGRELTASPRALEAYRRIGGRSRLYGIDVKDIPWVRKEFIGIFNDLEGQPITQPLQIQSKSRPALRLHSGGMTVKDILANDSLLNGGK